MPIASTDILFRYSGGGANTDPNLSLGGVMSTTEWVGGSAHDLFDIITGDENTALTADYRCVYILNNHGTLTWQSVLTWFSDIVAGGADIEMGLDPAGVGDGSSTGVATTIADENTAPTGVTFSTPASKAGGLAVGDVGPGLAFAVWFRRTATDSGALNNDGFTVRAEGDTAE